MKASKICTHLQVILFKLNVSLSIFLHFASSQETEESEKKLNSDEQRYCFRFSLPLFHFICIYVRPKQITMRISKNNILMLLNSFLYQLDLLLHKPNGMYSSGTIHTSSAENSWNSKKNVIETSQ